MATGTVRTITTVRHEFACPAPWPQGACWVEVEKVKTWALNAYLKAHPNVQEPSDDALRVRVTDEELVYYWEEEQR